MYYVYVIKNRAKEQTYIGCTRNLRRRLREHYEKAPELIYYEAYKDKRDATARETALKKRGQTVRRLKERLRHSLS